MHIDNQQTCSTSTLRSAAPSHAKPNSDNMARAAASCASVAAPPVPVSSPPRCPVSRAHTLVTRRCAPARAVATSTGRALVVVVVVVVVEVTALLLVGAGVREAVRDDEWGVNELRRVAPALTAVDEAVAASKIEPAGRV